MALSLKRVELSNIRSHEHIIFEPADEGLTSISGPNGSGKSTLVDSIAWGLYGTKPQGVSKAIAIVRTGANLGVDRCFARLDLEIDSRHIRVERRMVNKTGAVECEVFEKLPKIDGTIDWVNVAGPAISHAEPYIRKLLQMDEKGFLAAILIQQKQVDQLISATPRERAAVIEKLTGIASVTAAVTESRQEYNSLKKMVSFSTVNESELEELKKEKSAIQEDLKIRTSEFNKLSSTEKELKKKGESLREEELKESKKFDAASEAKHKITGLTASVQAREKELGRLIIDKNNKKGKLSRLTSGGSLQDLEKKRDDLKNELSLVREENYITKSSILDNEAKLKSYRALISISNVKEFSAAQSGMKTQEIKLAAVKKKIVSLSRETSNLESKKESVLNAIEIISDGQGECPTCLQKVADVEHSTSALKKEIVEIEKRTIKNSEEHEKIEITRITCELTIEKFNQLIEALEGKEKLRVINSKLNKKMNESSAQQKVFEGELHGIEKIYNEVKMEEELKYDYEQVLILTKEVSDDIEAMKQEINSLENRDFGTLTSAALAKLRKRLEVARNEYMSISGSLTEEKGEIKFLRERLKNLTEKIELQEKAILKHQQLLKSVEVASNSTQILEEFRTNRIEHSVPLIEAYSSDLLSRFTEGKFTRLKIDGKYNASVILSDGTERAIGLLSGGELSAAAMSLRLAVSMLLNGGSTQSLIIMDEVLVSQDSTRAELILQNIKETCRGQVILIAHNDSINDAADKLVALA